MKQFFSSIMNSWGSDTPQEVFWALNDLLTWAKSKGFQTHLWFEDPIDGNQQVDINNETLIEELTKFFESASY